MFVPNNCECITFTKIQVVAGMNYKFNIGIFLKNECLGGFSAVVYDRFGTLSVTDWGEELFCNFIISSLERDVLENAE